MTEGLSSISSTNTIRPDGRVGGSKLRPLSAEMSCTALSDGSAKFCSGATSVLVAVYGPVAARVSHRELSNRALISVVWKHSTTGGTLYGATERELERFVADALTCCVNTQNYPRTIIQVVIQVLTADGSVLSTAINAATLALLDAGVIPMNSLPIASTVLLRKPRESNLEDENTGIHNCDEVFLDPVKEEEAYPDSSALVLVTSSMVDTQPTKLVASMTFGQLASLESCLECMKFASENTRTTLAFVRMAVAQKVQKV